MVRFLRALRNQFRPHPPAAVVAPSEPVPLTVGPSKGTILIVDHEAQVRESLARYLREQGYTVLEAADGREALRHAEATLRPELLLCNMILPGMTTRQLIHLLGHRFPKHRILSYANYPHSLGIHNGLLDPAIQYMQKPLVNSRVVDRVQQMLP